MRTRAALFTLLAAVGVPGLAYAETLTFQPPVTNLNLDRAYVYTWRIDGVTIADLAAGNSNQIIRSAGLNFGWIGSWDVAANRLFTHLLDDATQTSTYLQSSANNGNNQLFRNVKSGVTDIDDDFSNPGNYSASAAALVAVNTRSTPLGQTSTTQYNSLGGTSSWMQGVKGSGLETASFTSEQEDYSYSFTEAQIASLADYLLHGNDFALALDPDARFVASEWEMWIDYGPPAAHAPEPASMLLLGTGLAGLVARRYRRSRQ